jgi:hypothetical protein
VGYASKNKYYKDQNITIFRIKTNYYRDQNKIYSGRGKKGRKEGG